MVHGREPLSSPLAAAPSVDDMALTPDHHFSAAKVVDLSAAKHHWLRYQCENSMFPTLVAYPQNRCRNQRLALNGFPEVSKDN